LAHSIARNREHQVTFLKKTRVIRIGYGVSTGFKGNIKIRFSGANTFEKEFSR
jgi:hypothetical protein